MVWRKSCISGRFPLSKNDKSSSILKPSTAPLVCSCVWVADYTKHHLLESRIKITIRRIINIRIYERIIIRRMSERSADDTEV